MPHVDIQYEKLPREIKDNLTPAQWKAAQPGVIDEGQPVPESTVYINLKNGLCRPYQAGEPANGPLLPTHDLSGGRGADDTQFHTKPHGAHTPT
jgi:hypothetical protein